MTAPTAGNSTSQRRHFGHKDLVHANASVINHHGHCQHRQPTQVIVNTRLQHGDPLGAIRIVLPGTRDNVSGRHFVDLPSGLLEAEGARGERGHYVVLVGHVD